MNAIVYLLIACHQKHKVLICKTLLGYLNGLDIPKEQNKSTYNLWS